MDLPHHASDINFAEVDFGVEIDDDADTDWAPTPRPFDGDEEDPPEMGDSDTCVGSEDETTPKAVKDDEVGGGEDVADLSGVHHEVVLDGDVKDKIRGKGAEEEEMTAEMAEVGAKEEMEVKMSHEGAPDAASEDEPTPRLMDYCESDPMVDVSAEEHEENTPRHSSEAKEGYIDWDPPTPSVFALDVPEPTAQEEDNGYIEWDAPTPAIFDDELSCNEEMTDINVEAPAVFSIPARTENKTQESPLPEIHPIALGNLLQNPKDIARLEDAIINYVLTTIPVVYEEITGYQLPVFVPTSGSSPRVSARSGQKRTSSGLSQSSGSAYSSNRNTPKKKRKNEDDDEDEDSRKRARRNGSPGTSTQMQRDERNYACLHYKHSPMRYPDCENRKWKREDIDLVA